jgi:hypothetical protein
MKANPIGFGMQKRWWRFLTLPSPRAEVGLLCEGECSLSPRPRAAWTSDLHADEPTCSRSKGQHPNLMKPVVVPLIDTAYRLPGKG